MQARELGIVRAGPETSSRSDGCERVRGLAGREVARDRGSSDEVDTAIENAGPRCARWTLDGRFAALDGIAASAVMLQGLPNGMPMRRLVHFVQQDLSQGQGLRLLIALRPGGARVRLVR